jgi:hypothetical protein
VFSVGTPRRRYPVAADATTSCSSFGRPQRWAHRAFEVLRVVDGDLDDTPSEDSPVAMEFLVGTGGETAIRTGVPNGLAPMVGAGYTEYRCGSSLAARFGSFGRGITTPNSRCEPGTTMFSGPTGARRQISSAPTRPRASSATIASFLTSKVTSTVWSLRLTTHTECATSGSLGRIKRTTTSTSRASEVVHANSPYQDQG